MRGGRSGALARAGAQPISESTERITARFARVVPLRPPRILCDLCVKSLLRVLCASVLNILFLAAAVAQNADAFSDTRDGGKLHAASGFVCPAKIGAFERDAVGEADPGKGVDFCAYSARNGTYGTIRLMPVNGSYDALASLAPDFGETEATGGKRVVDGLVTLSAKPQPLTVYARTYETAKLEDFRYRVLFSGAPFGKWAVETTIEYADPRDTGIEDQFLHAVYEAAPNEITAK
jgi:hypothetical protein